MFENVMQGSWIRIIFGPGCRQLGPTGQALSWQRGALVGADGGPGPQLQGLRMSPEYSAFQAPLFVG
jgi:hypothetical protein